MWTELHLGKLNKWNYFEWLSVDNTENNVTEQGARVWLCSHIAHDQVEWWACMNWMMNIQLCEMCIIYWLAEQPLVFQELCSVELVDYIVKVSLLMQIQLATNCPYRTGFSICSCRLCQLVKTSHIIVLKENSQGHSNWDFRFSF